MKKRRKITEIVIKESAEISSIIPNEDGTFSLKDSDGHPVDHEQHVSVSYLRNSGKPKILRSVVRDSDDQVGDNPWKKYDKIGFIDTNSREEGEQKLYVCSPSLLLWQDENKRFAYIHHVDLLAGYCSYDVNPERIGWRDFIQRMQASNLMNGADRMLVVVDSEKGSIPLINDRVEPVYSDFMLPDGFTIAYATSDSGTESWINKEMKRRDRVAGHVMVKVKEDQGFLKSLANSGELYIKNTFEEVT